MRVSPVAPAVYPKRIRTFGFATERMRLDGAWEFTIFDRIRAMMKSRTVSVDDHLIEPTSPWEWRLPATLRVRGHRMVNTRNGIAWAQTGRRLRSSGASAALLDEPLGHPPDGDRTKVLGTSAERPLNLDLATD